MPECPDDTEARTRANGTLPLDQRGKGVTAPAEFLARDAEDQYVSEDDKRHEDRHPLWPDRTAARENVDCHKSDEDAEDWSARAYT